MIDLHCHLDLYPKPASVFAEVARRGTYVLAVTTTPKAFDGNLRFAGSNKRIRVAVGLHPELVRERHREVDFLCSAMSRTRYVGEVGLDGSPDHRDSMQIQRDVLGKILAACREQGGKIISLHSKMAASAVLDELERGGPVGTPVLHWFSGRDDELRRAAEMGCWFSIGPAMLASRNGARLASMMPQNRVLPETDGPFAQVLGARLNPWDCEMVVPTLARMWGAAESDVSDRLMANFRNLVADSQPDHRKKVT